MIIIVLSGPMGWKSQRERFQLNIRRKLPILGKAAQRYVVDLFMKQSDAQYREHRSRDRITEMLESTTVGCGSLAEGVSSIKGLLKIIAEPELMGFLPCYLSCKYIL